MKHPMKTSLVLTLAAEMLDTGKHDYGCHAIQEIVDKNNHYSFPSRTVANIKEAYKSIFSDYEGNAWICHEWNLLLYPEDVIHRMNDPKYRQTKIMCLLFAAYICELEGD